jgi:predicted PurR-regulated permease PerM
LAALEQNELPPQESIRSHAWTWQNICLFLFTAVLIGLSLTVASPFATALVWSIAIAVAVQRPYQWLLRKTHRPGLAALLGTIGVMLVILIPAALLLERLLSQFLNVLPVVTSGAAQGMLQSYLQQHPKFQELVNKATAGVDIQSSVRSAAGWLGGKLQGTLAQSVAMITQIAVTLYALFFLLRDGKQAKQALLSIMPMPAAAANNLLTRMQQSIEASILGSLSIAAIQGMLGGLIFAALSVPNAILWAFVMGALATIPSLGTFLVWAPVAVFLAISGHLVKAAILAGFGACVIGSIDNVLYPSLVSRKLNMHPLAAFFAVLGGVAVFGIKGLLLGPLILVVTTELLRFWRPGALRVPTAD